MIFRHKKKKFLQNKDFLLSIVVEKDKDTHELHVNLDQEIFNKLDIVKDYYGIKNTTDIIRLIITKIHRKIIKNNSDYLNP